MESQEGGGRRCEGASMGVAHIKSLHCVFDVVFREDDRRGRTAHEAHTLGTLRRLALNMIKSTLFNKASIRSRRLFAAWSNVYLAKVLAI